MSKILVVDDIADNVKLLSYDLEDAGYEVSTASDGQEALDLLHAHGTDIVLTDWMMPGMDGVSLCKHIRASEGVRSTYIIMLTALTDKERLVEAFEAGADDFISKPIHHPELFARLKAGVRITELETQIDKERMAIYKANAELAVLNDKLEEIATTDELTGLPNRREAMQRLAEHWEASHHNDNLMSCILLDIDHFKQCNDTHGHDVGDAVLRETAKILRFVTRASEAPCRVGGEEFLLICPTACANDAIQGAERMRKAVEVNQISCGNLKLSITISLGVADSGAPISGFEELLKRADQALYAAKRARRNCTCIYGDTLYQQSLLTVSANEEAVISTTSPSQA